MRGFLIPPGCYSQGPDDAPVGVTQLGISPTRRVGGLGSTQRAALIATALLAGSPAPQRDGPSRPRARVSDSYLAHPGISVYRPTTGSGVRRGQ